MQFFTNNSNAKKNSEFFLSFKTVPTLVFTNNLPFSCAKIISYLYIKKNKYHRKKIKIHKKIEINTSNERLFKSEQILAYIEAKVLKLHIFDTRLT